MKFKLVCRRFLYLCYYAVIKLLTLSPGRKRSQEELYRGYFRILSALGFRFTAMVANRTIAYDPRLSAVGQRFYFEGSFEQTQLDTIRQYVKTDGIVFDIGANIGTHTVFFSDIARSGSVFAFEPARAPYHLLLRNIDGIPNVIPVNLALSNASAEMDFYECDDNALSGLKDTLRSKIRTRSKTLVTTGDTFFELFSLPRLDFVKIDVEGFERDVIAGMKKTLRKFHPVIFCEIYQGTNSNPDPVGTTRDVMSLGYSAFVLHENTVVPFSGSHDDDFYDYLFLPLPKK